jgi:hypothetical protein
MGYLHQYSGVDLRIFTMEIYKWKSSDLSIELKVVAEIKREWRWRTIELFIAIVLKKFKEIETNKIDLVSFDLP